MSGGTTLALARRLRDPRFAACYFVGDAIDIGCGPDSLARQGCWPNLRSVFDWDLPQGDAVVMAGAPSESFDLVYSSHCLEHVSDPRAAVRRWWELLKPGGHLVLVVPDEDLYEQGQFPSTNTGHRSTWTLWKLTSWSPASVNILPLLAEQPRARLIKAEWIEDGFDYGIGRADQTAAGVECGIECIVRKEKP